MTPASDNQIKNNPVKVFISYCHDSVSFDKKVLDLSAKLIEDGIDSVLDQYIQSPPEGWVSWMLTQIKSADFVLIICTQNYYDRSLKKQRGDSGKGTRFESLISFTEIYENFGVNEKFIPVVLTDDQKKYIPDPLKPYDWYNLEGYKDYEKMYRRLTEQPLIIKPAIGSLKKLETGINLSEVPDNAAQADVSKTGQTASLRQTETSDTSLIEVDITVDEDFDNYSQEQMDDFVKTVKAILSVRRNIRIIRKRRGSVILTLALTDDEYKSLTTLYKAGKLTALKVTDINYLPGVISYRADEKSLKEARISASGRLYKSKGGTAKSVATVATISEMLTTLTLKDIQELADILKTEYGVEPAAVAVVARSDEASTKQEDEQKTFNVILTSGGANKLNIVKIIKDLTGLGLKEAKDLVDNAPVEIKTGVGKTEAEEIQAKLNESGGEAVIS